MAGPYATHEAALNHVDPARTIAEGIDPRVWFMAWGTVRIEGSTQVGRLNALGLI